MSDDDATAVPDDPDGRGFDRRRIDDSLQQAFAPGPMEWGKHADGLPTPKIRQSLPTAPPLALDTMVCLGDQSTFVIRRRGWGDELARFGPEVVKRADGGGYYVSLLEAIGQGVPWGEIVRQLDLRTGRVPVEPVRPQCKFLAQQMVDLQDASSHQMVERLCTARRDDESFFVSLRDTQVYACELRSPADPASMKRIEVFNETKIALGADRIRESGGEFDVDGALERAREEALGEGLGHTSIFDSTPKA